MNTYFKKLAEKASQLPLPTEQLFDDLYRGTEPKSTISCIKSATLSNLTHPNSSGPKARIGYFC
jgi:hypothetical protein